MATLRKTKINTTFVSIDGRRVFALKWMISAVVRARIFARLQAIE